jgi:hypothetical protein
MLKLSAPVLALICVPLGFVLPLIFGLQGLAVWPLAVGIWSVGVLLSLPQSANANSSRDWRLAALSANAALAVVFLALYFVIGGVTLH